MKTLEIVRRSTPTDPARGYGDTVTVYDGVDVKFTLLCSSCPNPFRPSDLVPWDKAYCLLAFGEMSGECVLHNRYGKCILINNGGEVPTMFPNPLQDGRFFAKEIFIHAGGGLDSKEWRGSKGCITLNPIDLDVLMSVFAIGEKCIVEIAHDEKERKSA